MKKYTSARSLRGKRVYMNSQGAAWAYRFIRWVKTKKYSGGEDTEEIAVGALVFVLWRCEAPFHVRPPSGFRKGHFVLRSYWPLYRSSRDCYLNRNPINRPPVSRVKMSRDAR